ncbi:hypothetical protein EWM64_g10545, partial [Hericium alpestre]
MWPMLVDFISTHLYVNSCLATRNSRNYLRSIDSKNRTGLEPSNFLSADHAIQFEHPQALTTARGRSSGNIELNTTGTSDV